MSGITALFLWKINEHRKYGLQYKSKQELELSHQTFNIKLDFTIKLADDFVFNCEHLGMQDSKTFYQD